MTSITGYWLIKVNKLLPEIIPLPEMVAWAIIILSIVGIGYHKKGYKSLFPIMTIYGVLSWIYITKAFPVALSFGEKLADNPYVDISAFKIAKTSANMPFYLALPFLILMMRTLMVLQRTDPLYKDHEEEVTLKYGINLIKSKARNLRGKISKLKSLRSTWKKENTPSFKDKLKETWHILTDFDSQEKHSITVCVDVNTQQEVTLPLKNAYQHFLVVGPTGSGKTASVLEPMAWHVIKQIMEKRKMGITVVEPKGDLIATIAEWCDMLNIPYTRIDPMLGEKSAKFNPLQGDIYMAAEGTRAVMRKMFGKQEAFFGLVQEMAARNTILLLKRIKGDDLDLNTVRRALRSQEEIRRYVHQLKQISGQNDDLVQYFDQEVLGGQRDKFQQFAMGLRLQFEDLMGNETLERVITGESDIDLDKHLDKGGILLVNTAMGELGKLGDAFGTFITMHLQNAIFRRPGTPKTRTPHLFMLDEAPRYINPDFERLLAIGRSFCCSCVLATQSLSQLEMEEKSAFVNVAMSNCQNKIVFGGINNEDALYFEKEFGEVERITTRATYDKMFTPQILPKHYQNLRTLEPRYSYTEIMDLDNYQFIYRLAKGGGIGRTDIGKGVLVNPPVDFAPYLKKLRKEEKNQKREQQKQKPENQAAEEKAVTEEGFTFVFTPQEPPSEGSAPEKETNVQKNEPSKKQNKELPKAEKSTEQDQTCQEQREAYEKEMQREIDLLAAHLIQQDIESNKKEPELFVQEQYNFTPEEEGWNI